MFKLLIECSKDITALKIDFADGTSTITSSTNQPSPRVNKKSTEDKSEAEQTQNITKGRLEAFLDTDVDYSSISQEIVKLPKIDIPDRPVSVAPELQNLDF